MIFGIIIRMSGVRVPPPLPNTPLKTLSFLGFFFNGSFFKVRFKVRSDAAIDSQRSNPLSPNRAGECHRNGINHRHRRIHPQTH
jgi:hypothetical protein